MFCSNVSPLAVRQRLARHFHKITYPRMHLVYDYPQGVYWLICDDAPVRQVGPIVNADLLPLARYFGAYRPAERCKTYALKLPDGTTIPEGKLRHKLHVQFTTAALRDMQLQMRGKGETVQQSTDASNVAAPVPEQDLSKLYTTDLDDTQRQQLAQKLEATALSASDVEYAEDLDPSP